MSVPRGTFGVGVALLFVFVTGCSPPPSPSAETRALEDSLLSEADVGGAFEVASQGGIGISGGGICPESDFGFDSVGAVRVSFVAKTNGDEITIEETLRVAAPNELDDLFPAMKAAYRACFGEVWTDYGDTQTVGSMEVPDVGDDRIAVHARHGDPPFDGRHDDIRLVYVRSGDIFAEVSLAEIHEDGSEGPRVSDAEFARIVREAIAKLSS
jgi:hypothetical protein